MKKIATLLCLCFCFGSLIAQKKTLDHSAYKIWKKTNNPKLSNDGNWLAYNTLCNADCDATLHLWNAKTGVTKTFERGVEAQFAFDNSVLVFKIKQPLDSLKAKRRKKVKDDDLPKDSLGIYTLATGNLTTIAQVKSFALPQKWAGFVAYQLEIEKVAEKPSSKMPKDTPSVSSTQNPAPKPKIESKDNGTKLILLNLASNKKDTFLYVTEYIFAKKGKNLLLADTGKDSVEVASVDLINCENGTKTTLFQQNKAKFKQLSLDDLGTQAAYIADLDTTKERVRPFQLHYYGKNATLKTIMRSNADEGTMKNVLVSDNAKPTFSEDGSKLFFGIAPQPILNDTTLLPEEIVNVEVWTYSDPKFHAQQKVQLEAEKKKSFQTLYNTQTGAIVPLSDTRIEDINFAPKRNADFAVGFYDERYLLAASWEGGARRDVYLMDLKTGSRTLAMTGMRGFFNVSPSAKYIYGYSALDSAWLMYNISTKKTTQLTDNKVVRFYEEENDMPNYPSTNGMAGWSKDDKYVLVYDRYDIWRFDPLSIEKPLRLTRGRETKTAYRHIRLDEEEPAIDLSQPLMLHTFNDITKAEGYATLNTTTQIVSAILQDNYRFSPQVLKADNANAYVFTRQNFQTFPDIQYTTDFKTVQKVSDVNPQQQEYAWGAIELVEWRSLNGEILRGMLVKPADFDPKKKYPMIVNFYEKSSDELHNYRGIEPLRSSINYSFYANRGYVIFNPDVPYRIGYPGESCLNSVVSGVTHLVSQGYIDDKRIAIQGHSWGGYQAAYLITKTNIFRCAESGAPVVNMFSAYNGVRWESGLLRQFQYEHSQSRIGGTPWEYPLRYMENSPIFSADKIQTPVLILHNDKDGAVPWYQGIEFYGAMRRLNKPAWLLNYNEEPHWPVKLQNRIDFQTRMQQFFDYYLKDAPMPTWMKTGVSAMEKGIIQHLDLEEGN